MTKTPATTKPGAASDSGGPLPEPQRVHLVSLGCPKNLVDSETLLGHIGRAGYVLTDGADDADILVVNTCGFIDNAKEESIQAILEACGHKEDDPSKKVVVAGCLGQRYNEELREQIPEVDAIVGLGEYEHIGTVLEDLERDDTVAPDMLVRVSKQDQPCNEEIERLRLTPSHYAYVKISEGCDNPCTFCSIPSIRGGFRSKPIEAIEREVRGLVETGVREVVLIAQDSTSYGIDLYGDYTLAPMLERVAAIDGLDWIRILYAYPAFLTDPMIDAMASIDKVVNYLDMPLQHISAPMLRHMGRRMTEDKTRALLDRLRERVPGIYLRTTFIVGFPAKTTDSSRSSDDSSKSSASSASASLRIRRKRRLRPRSSPIRSRRPSRKSDWRL